MQFHWAQQEQTLTQAAASGLASTTDSATHFTQGLFYSKKTSQKLYKFCISVEFSSLWEPQNYFISWFTCCAQVNTELRCLFQM